MKQLQPDVIVVAMMLNHSEHSYRDEGADTSLWELPLPRRDFGRYEAYVDGLSAILPGLAAEGVIEISHVPRDQE